MLLRSDEHALASSRLLPQSRNAIAHVVGIRAATVDIAQFTAPLPGSNTVCLANQFEAGELRAGSHIRFRLFGVVTNSGTGPEALSPTIHVTQASSSQVLSLQAQTINAGSTAWDVDAVLSFNRPGAPIPRVAGKSRFAASPRPASTNALAVGGFIRLAQSNTTFSISLTQAGGNWLAASSGTTASALAASVDPNNALVTSARGAIGVTLELETGPHVAAVIQGGWMEVLG